MEMKLSSPHFPQPRQRPNRAAQLIMTMTNRETRVSKC
jgi:hypothetical protein